MRNKLAEGGGRGMAKLTLEPDSHLGDLGAQVQGLALRPLIWAGPHPALAKTPWIRALNSWDAAGLWVGGS